MSTRKYDQVLRAEAAEQTRRRILDAVAQRVREAPSEQLSLDQVARLARVSRSTIYADFGSRAGLFTERCVGRPAVLDQWAGGTAAPFPAGGRSGPGGWRSLPGRRRLRASSGTSCPAALFSLETRELDRSPCGMPGRVGRGAPTGRR